MPGSGITDKYWAATLLPDPDAKIQARFFVRPDRHAQDLSDRLSARSRRPSRRAPPAPPMRGCSPAPRKSSTIDGYDEALKLNRFELLIDWGYFYFITKPLFLAMDWIYRFFGNFGVAILLDHRPHQDLLLPARQQVLRLDGEDEGGAAGDDGDPRALRRRQDEAAAGDDGALQEGEDQSDRRLPADPDPDPGVLRALQGAVHHHRDAARAVLRLDQGPLRARPDHDLQPVRADSLGPVDACRWSARSSCSASGRSSWASRCGSR